MENYNEMSNEKLVEELNRYLSKEQRSTITAMTDGLFNKLQLLDIVKEQLKAKYIDTVDESKVKTQEWVEDYLAKSLALTKEKEGSSLALRDGRLALYDYFGLVVDKEIKNSEKFQFLASLSARDQSLEVLQLKSILSLILEITDGQSDLFPKELRLTTKQRISGIKKLSKKEEKELAAKL